MIKKLTQFYQTLQNHQKELQGSLLILSVLTLFFCREVSGYFSNFNVDYWFDYFIVVERLSMLLLLLSASNYLKEKCWLVYEILLCFLTQDFIDRVVFNISCFNVNDVIAIIFIFIRLLIRIKQRKDGSK